MLTPHSHSPPLSITQSPSHASPVHSLSLSVTAPHVESRLRHSAPVTAHPSQRLATLTPLSLWRLSHSPSPPVSQFCQVWFCDCVICSFRFVIFVPKLWVSCVTLFDFIVLVFYKKEYVTMVLPYNHHCNLKGWLYCYPSTPPILMNNY